MVSILVWLHLYWGSNWLGAYVLLKPEARRISQNSLFFFFSFPWKPLFLLKSSAHAQLNMVQEKDFIDWARSELSSPLCPSLPVTLGKMAYFCASAPSAVQWEKHLSLTWKIGADCSLKCSLKRKLHNSQELAVINCLNSLPHPWIQLICKSKGRISRNYIPAST